MRLSNFILAKDPTLADAMSAFARANYEVEASAKGIAPGEGVLKMGQSEGPSSQEGGDALQQRESRGNDGYIQGMLGASTSSRAASLTKLLAVILGGAAKDGFSSAAIINVPASTQYAMLPSRTLFLSLSLASIVDSALDANKSAVVLSQSASQRPSEENERPRLTELQEDVFSAFFDARAAEAFVAQLGPFQAFDSEMIDSILRGLTDFASEVIQKLSQALAKGYVTFLNQLEENYEAFASIIDSLSSPAGFKLSAYLLELDMPEGPRTPSFNLPLLGAGIDGDTNTLRILDIENLSIFGSLTEKGDPSDKNPDQNDLSGQVEANVAGLLVGANFQNGVYVGSYTPETETSEAHHQFQTGMVDQSGPYAFGDRLESLNAVSLSPEAEPKNDNLIVGDLIPFDLSVEGLSAFLDSQEREYVLPKTDFRTYEDILDEVISSSSIKPSEMGFDLDPAITESALFEEIDLDSILAVASKVEMASPEVAETLTGLQTTDFDLSSYLGGLKGLNPGESASFGTLPISGGSVI